MNKYKKVLIGGIVTMIPVHTVLPAQHDESKHEDAVRLDEVHQEPYEPTNMIGRGATAVLVSAAPASDSDPSLAEIIAKYGGTYLTLK